MKRSAKDTWPRVLGSGTADTRYSQGPEGHLSGSLDQGIFSELACSLVPPQCRQRARHGAGALRVRTWRKGFWRLQRGHEDRGGPRGPLQRPTAQAGTVRPLRLAGGRKVDFCACAGPPAAAGAGLGGGRPLLRRCAASYAPGRRWLSASGQHRVGANGFAGCEPSRILT